MKYQFFLREQPLNEGGSQSYLVIVPANSAGAHAQTAVQALITRHQMHTCVNLPFGNGHKVSFRLSYTEMDGLTHPILLIISSEFGAFKLPFEAGRQGYVHFHQTYNRLKVRLMEHHNKKLARLADGQRNVHRIGHSQRQPATQNVAMAANGDTRPSGVSTRSTTEPRRRVHPNRRAANEPDTQQPKRRQSPKNGPASQTKTEPSVAMNLLKWTAGGMIGAMVILVLILGASTAIAGESQASQADKPSKTDSDNGFYGFPVPDTDVPLVKARASSSCSAIGFQSAQLSGLLSDTKEDSN
jgi:hypothetical protein